MSFLYILFVFLCDKHPISRIEPLKLTDNTIGIRYKELYVFLGGIDRFRIIDYSKILFRPNSKITIDQAFIELDRTIKIENFLK